MKLKLQQPREVTLDLISQKLKELRFYLGLKKLQLFYLNSRYLKGFRNNFSIFELTFSKNHFKKNFKIIYTFHIKKKQILFVGFEPLLKNLNFKTMFYKYNHLYISEVWFSSLFSNYNKNKISQYLKSQLLKVMQNKNSSKVSKIINEFSRFTEAPDLIVIIFAKKNISILKEISLFKNPSIVLASDANNLSAITYKMFGSFTTYKKKFFFYYMLKALFSITKVKKKNYEKKRI